MFNESSVNTSINSSIYQLEAPVVHAAAGECSSNHLGDTYMAIRGGNEINRCAIHKSSIAETYLDETTSVIYLKQDKVNPFGITDAPSSCTTNAVCVHNRIYANIDDCKAYAASVGRPFWLLRSSKDLIFNGNSFTLRLTVCGICTADGQVASFDPPSGTESNVCPAGGEGGGDGIRQG